MSTRTQDEIAAQMEAWKSEDWMGTKLGDLVTYLDFEHAKPYLKDSVTEESWQYKECTRENIITEMKDYLSFAWEKANNFRGISAGRSMDHYEAWNWLLNEPAIANFSSYEFYGKDHLVKVGEYLGIDTANLDDGVRQNEEY